VGGGLFSFLRGFYCSLFWGFSSVSGVWVLLFLLGFCGFALVVPVYIGAPYAFINKVFLLIKKKNIWMEAYNSPLFSSYNEFLEFCSSFSPL
jgi:hypothetical protein